MLNKIQYISQGASAKEQLENISQVLDAGCSWLQLRYKHVPQQQVLQLAEAVKKITENYSCKLIINDFPEIAKEIDADGVHLGLDDMDVQAARSIVGFDKFIGGTANTLHHVIKRHEEQCDYIGLGPFRFTVTKEKLSPVLGLEGYTDIMSQLYSRHITTPVFAIGGIQQEDIEPILKTGVYGVALSGLISNHPNKKELFSQLHLL